MTFLVGGDEVGGDSEDEMEHATGGGDSVSFVELSSVSMLWYSISFMGLGVRMVGALGGIDEVGGDSEEEKVRATGGGDDSDGPEDDSAGIDGEIFGGVEVDVDAGASGEGEPAGHHRSGKFGCGGGAPAGHHL